MTTPTIDKFFCDYDDNDVDQSLNNARVYIATRLVADVEGVRQALVFTPRGRSILRCQTYGHTILLQTTDNVLHPRAGGRRR